MPALPQLIPRFTDDISAGAGGVTATGIGLIVGVGIIPAVLLLWVACWLMICYPHDRTCWCTKSRKRRAREDLGERGPELPPSAETLNEKRAQNVHRPADTYRTESGSSYGSNRLSKPDPMTAHATRMSVQSTNSDRTIAVHQEPKPFV